VEPRDGSDPNRYKWRVQDGPLPALVDAKRRLAGELLASAAVHSAITDELAALEQLTATRPLTQAEEERRTILRARKREALRRHDAVDRRLRRLSDQLRASALHARREHRV